MQLDSVPGTFKTLCGINEDKTVDLNKILFYSSYLFIATLTFLFLMTKLYKNLQMFPIKEKSGRLILMFLLFNYLFLMSYPLLLLINFNFEQDNYQGQNSISGVLRFLYNFYVVTYLARALRIHYAYDVKKSLEGTTYRIIRSENILCFLTFIIGALIFWAPYDIMPYQENIFDGPEQQDERFFQNYKIQKLLVLLFDQLVLLFSLFIIRKARTTFKIQTELAYAIMLEFGFSFVKRSFGLYMQQIGQNPICCNGYPLYYAFDSSKIYALVWITVVIPLIQVAQVPQHFPYPIVADNFELFLSEPLCIDIFHQFLLHCDDKIQRAQLYKRSHKKVVSLDIEKSYNKSFDSNQNVQFSQDQQMNTLDLNNQSEFNDEKANEDEQKSYNSIMISGLNSTKTAKTTQKLSQVNTNIHTSECYILWMDLTLILGNYDALNQSEPLVDPNSLENEIINYMVNLVRTTNLETMMPTKLAEEIRIRFFQSNNILQEPVRISQNLMANNFRQSQKRLSNVLKAQKSKPNSTSEDEKIDNQDNQENYNISHYRVLQIAYEVRFLMFEILSKIFTHKYQKTKSFHTIRRIFSLNEETQFRLYNLNLTKEFKCI